MARNEGTLSGHRQRPPRPPRQGSSSARTESGQIDNPAFNTDHLPDATDVPREAADDLYCHLPTAAVAAGNDSAVAWLSPTAPMLDCGRDQPTPGGHRHGLRAGQVPFTRFSPLSIARMGN
ncbi:hypothetical protein GCM10022282_12620 [Agromyces indicus]